MRKIFLIFLVTVTAIIFSGCCHFFPWGDNESPQENDEPVQIEDVTTMVPCWFESEGVPTLVNDYASLYEICSSADSIDFSNNSVILVSGHSTFGISNISAEMTRNGGIYTLTINVTQNFATVVQPWRKCYKTPKITSPDNIQLIVNYAH